MDAKPKRKTTFDSNVVEFVTELSMAECLERLEHGPSHTLAYRLNVRISGTQFIVDALEELPRQGLRVVAELSGSLASQSDGHTQVKAYFTDKTHKKPDQEQLLRAGTIYIVFMTVVFIALNGLSRGIIMGLGAGAIYLVGMWLVTFLSERHNTYPSVDLKPWLRKLLNAPPRW